MPKTQHLLPGVPFPPITLKRPDGGNVDLSAPGWRAVFVIRGAHCGICRQYLGQIEERRSAWEARGIEVVAISADPPATAGVFAQEAGFGGVVGAGLSVHDMTTLDLWMTAPEHSNLDYVHAEPAFFLIDPEGNTAFVEGSNLPAMRPDLDWLEKGFGFILDNDLRPNFGKYEVPA